MSSRAAPRIDHVMMVTVEPERDLEELRSAGLAVTPGVVFEDGVKNWVVHMKSGQYLEVLTADPDNESGEWIRECVKRGSRFAGWAVEVPSVDDVAARLELPVREGVRIKGDEGSPRWRTVDTPKLMSSLPFFITYEWTARRGTPEFEERSTEWLRETAGEVIAEGISSMTVVGDPEQLRAWVGTDLPVKVQPGDRPGLIEVTVSTTAGDVVIRDLTAR